MDFQYNYTASLYGVHTKPAERLTKEVRCGRPSDEVLQKCTFSASEVRLQINDFEREGKTEMKCGRKSLWTSLVTRRAYFI